MGNQPAGRIKHGKVSATIWPREYEGKISYSAQIEKNYYDKQSSQWKSTSSFTASDLGDVLIVAQMAAVKIYQLNEKSKQQGNQQAQMVDRVFNQPQNNAPQQSNQPSFEDDMPF